MTPKSRENYFWIPLVLCASSIALFWPGFMSQDPVDQYEQAFTGEFNSDHPPIMAVVWRFLLSFGDGPAPMLIFHAVIFWSGMWLMARRFSGASRVALLLLPCLMPALFVQLGMIWKDTGLTACLVLALALLMNAKDGAHAHRYCVGAAVPLFYATAVRHNAVFAVFPFCVWLASIWKERSWLKNLAAGGFLTLSLFAAAQMFNRAVGETRTSIFYYSLVGDVTALSLHSGTDLRPRFLQEKEPLEWEAWPELFTDSFKCLLGIRHWRPANEAEGAEIRSHWRRAVLRYPLAYLRYRLGIFSGAIGLTVPKQHHAYLKRTYANPNRFRFANEGNVANRAYFETLDSLRHTPLFRVYLYLVICFICLVAYTTSAVRESAVGVMATSGFLYVGSLFFSAPHYDFRYGYWTVAAATLSSFLTIREFLTRIYFSTNGKRVLLPSEFFSKRLGGYK